MQIVQENLSHLRPIRMEKVNIPACISEATEMVHVPSGIHIEMKDLDTLPAVIAGRQSLTFVFRNLMKTSSQP
jgi:hypothetical protein